MHQINRGDITLILSSDQRLWVTEFTIEKSNIHYSCMYQDLRKPK
jgi:hypothetical protein